MTISSTYRRAVHDSKLHPCSACGVLTVRSGRCATCNAKRRGYNGVEKHHLLGRYNSDDIAVIPAHIHEELTFAQTLQPTPLKHAPRGVLMDAKRLYAIVDMLDVIDMFGIADMVTVAPATHDVLHDILTELASIMRMELT